MGFVLKSMNFVLKMMISMQTAQVVGGTVTVSLCV